MSRPPRVFLAAGEASGDRLGAGLARALRARCPDIELFGMGGEAMSAAGVEQIQDAHAVAVSGIVEVLAHLPVIRRAMAKLERALTDRAPDLLVPIDFPDFNLRLAARAGKVGVPVVYYVSPQVWAWRPGRIHRIRELVRRMLVLFPFETRIYEEAGLPVTFVGHPVADRDESGPPPEQIAEGLGLDPARPIVGLLPGSRRTEIGRQLPGMLGAAALLGRDRPDLQWLLPLAPGIDEAWVRGRLRDHDLPITIYAGNFPDLLRCCATGAVAAGTATLEAASVGLPMVVVYRMNPLSYFVGRSLVKLEHVALPNLVAGSRIVPELIQGEFTPERLASTLAEFLDDRARADGVRAELYRMRERLGGAGAFDRAADAVLAELAEIRGS